MKIFKNATTTIPVKDSEGKMMTFIDLAITVINQSQASPQGFLPSEMRQRMKILDVLEKAKDQESVELEDEFAAKLVACAENMYWVVLHKDLVSFHDAVDTLK